MNSKINRILVVDDEAKYLRGIRAVLEIQGYEILTAQNGHAALELAARENPNLVLLDVLMPGMDGYEVCQRIREFSTAPVIMLTALAETANKVKGLEGGADDYVTKPFSTGELLARVNAALRRVEFADQPAPLPVIQVRDLRIDLAQQRVFLAGKEIKLTATEYRLLCELAWQVGRVLSPEFLLERVWGVGYEGEDRLVWRTINRLRKKIEQDPKLPQYIETRVGSGYLLSNG